MRNDGRYYQARPHFFFPQETEWGNRHGDEITFLVNAVISKETA